MIGLKASFALWALLPAAFLAGCEAVPLRDGFEDRKKQIDQVIWRIDQVPGRAFIQSRQAVDQFNTFRREEGMHAAIQYAPEGQQAVVVRAFPWDTVTDEDGRNIVKHELWLQRTHWSRADKETWYGFWLQVDLTHDAGTPTRFVVAQWKEEAGDAETGSPFVAIRYDNKKLAITVQDNDCRVTIAASAGSSPRSPCSRTIALFDAEGRMVTSPPQIDNVDHWVEFKIGVRRGRDDEPGGSQGEVAVIQRDRQGLERKIVTAKGNIGNHGAGPLGYFKFGVYRDYDSSECFRSRAEDRCATIDVRLDDFRRAGSLDALSGADRGSR